MYLSLITKLDIDNIAKAMRIEINSTDQYIDDIQTVIQYFTMLDNVDVNSIQIELPETNLKNLRNDEHIEYDNKLIYAFKSYKNFIRSPKLI